MFSSCRVYNYYAGTSNPSTCAVPSQSTNNNGNVAGMYYTGNAGLGQLAATYHYDGVNRLTSAAVSGTNNYSQTYTYDAFGNLSCTPAGPGCSNFIYSIPTNRIASYGYDAAGNVTNDNTYTYY